MTEKPPAPRGRPATNKIERIPALPKDIAKAIFRAAEKNTRKSAKPKRKKPN